MTKPRGLQSPGYTCNTQRQANQNQKPSGAHQQHVDGVVARRPRVHIEGQPQLVGQIYLRSKHLALRRLEALVAVHDMGGEVQTHLKAGARGGRE